MAYVREKIVFFCVFFVQQHCTWIRRNADGKGVKFGLQEHTKCKLTTQQHLTACFCLEKKGGATKTHHTQVSVYILPHFFILNTFTSHGTKTTSRPTTTHTSTSKTTRTHTHAHTHTHTTRKQTKIHKKHHVVHQLIIRSFIQSPPRTPPPSSAAAAVGTV